MSGICRTVAKECDICNTRWTAGPLPSRAFIYRWRMRLKAALGESSLPLAAYRQQCTGNEPVRVLLRILLIGVGGALGAITRYLAGLACLRLLGDRFAFGTLAVNVAGCLLLGLLMQVSSRSVAGTSGLAPMALSAGFLGGLTTFSTFGYETFHYLQSRRLGVAMLNITANLLLGLAAVWGGLQWGERFYR